MIDLLQNHALAFFYMYNFDRNHVCTVFRTKLWRSFPIATPATRNRAGRFVFLSLGVPFAYNYMAWNSRGFLDFHLCTLPATSSRVVRLNCSGHEFKQAGG